MKKLIVLLLSLILIVPLVSILSNDPYEIFFQPEFFLWRLYWIGIAMIGFGFYFYTIVGIEDLQRKETDELKRSGKTQGQIDILIKDHSNRFVVRQVMMYLVFIFLTILVILYFDIFGNFDLSDN